MENHQAMFWEVEIDKIRCHLCPHLCLIGEGQLGICQTRQNINNELIAINYGEITSIALDPMEKKPLYHFKPGKKILSVGTFGCNMKCSYCQNHHISQQRAFSDFKTPDELIKMINQVENNMGIAFTYNEPFMWYEYMYEVAKKVKEQNPNQVIVIVTNGYINPEPLSKILPYVDAMNIDLKAFQESFYQKICKATLDPVLKTIEMAHTKCHVEVTSLMVTEENDSVEEIEKIAQFLGNLNKDIPLHLSRYFPNFKMHYPPTDINKMKKAKEVALKYLNYVYIGNVLYEDVSTYCPICHHVIFNREDLNCTVLKDNKCAKCGNVISMII